MQDKYTVLDDSKFYDDKVTILRSGAKLAKLSTYQVFKPKTEAIMSSVRVVPTNDAEPTETSQSIERQQVSSTQEIEMTPQVEEEIEQAPQLPSKDLVNAKLQKLNVTVYNDLPANVINLEEYRRLRVDPKVQESLENVISLSDISHEPLLANDDLAINDLAIDDSYNEDEVQDTPNLNDLQTPNFLDSLSDMNTYDNSNINSYEEADLPYEENKGEASVDDYLNNNYMSGSINNSQTKSNISSDGTNISEFSSLLKKYIESEERLANLNQEDLEVTREINIIDEKMLNRIKTLQERLEANAKKELEEQRKLSAKKTKLYQLMKAFEEADGYDNEDFGKRRSM